MHKYRYKLMKVGGDKSPSTLHLKFHPLYVHMIVVCINVINNTPQGMSMTFMWTSVATTTCTSCLGRGRWIMLENLPIMLCCTAPKMYLLCSLNYQQNSFPDYLTRKLTRSLRTFLIALTELASHQCLAVHLL